MFSRTCSLNLVRQTLSFRLGWVTSKPQRFACLSLPDDKHTPPGSAFTRGSDEPTQVFLFP